MLGKRSSRQRLAIYLPFRRVRRHYVRTSREVKRWEATTRSPVFASFSAVLKASFWSCRTMWQVSRGRWQTTKLDQCVGVQLGSSRCCAVLSSRPPS